MKISVLTLGELQTNCYLVYDEATGNCAVIDPGYDGASVKQALEEQNLTLCMILLTHGHYDHIGGVQALRSGTQAPVYIHEKDTRLPISMTHAPVFYTETYAEGDVIAMDSISFRVLSTPGHSAGSVCLLADGILFTGDTLFRGSCGRTDFPTGSYPQMLQSLARIYRLPGNLKILPGHGSLSMLDCERENNPYMLEAIKA